eukprot:TRINITY_DN1050_c0_g1_i1.p2 TRINITY_DN1050_c0_g1~~TRINITY_DN1050_c0_g1_i1.p2  ORF type:complete len:68 (-),score=2.61 TRINITY_DN1050_c0_g1_i1:185-388(-)
MNEEVLIIFPNFLIRQIRSISSIRGQGLQAPNCSMFLEKVKGALSPQGVSKAEHLNQHCNQMKYIMQ